MSQTIRIGWPTSWGLCTGLLVVAVFAVANMRSAMAQDSEALEEKLRTVQGTERVRVLNELAVDNVFRSPKESMALAEQALSLAQELSDRRGTAIALRTIGVLTSIGGDYRKAIETSRKALTIFEELEDPHDITLVLNNRIGARRELAKTYISIGQLELEFGRFDSAKEYLTRGAEMAGEIGAKEIAKKAHLLLTALFESLDDSRAALGHFREYVAAKDAMFDQQTRNKIAEMQSRFEASQRDHEISLLAKNNEIQLLTVERERFRRNSLLVGLLMVVILFAIVFRNYLYLFAFWKRKTHIGHYRIMETIGSGGMGVVFRAVDIMDETRELAIKVIREELSQDPIQRKRFLHEAALVDRIDHPNIVKVHERGQHDNRLYIAMEILAGRSLADVVGSGEMLAMDACVAIMHQLADALAQVHGKGIVHRDIKPENVVLADSAGPSPHIKLLDFGLARSDTLTRLTEAGEVVGTIGYLAPEQITGQESTAASDMYSLGVVFYELCTLQKPFVGDTPAEIIKQALERQPLDPTHYRPELPAALNNLIMNMLEKDFNQRPSDRSVLETLAVCH